MKKVLIVDDAAFMRVSIKNMLTKNGYEVIGEAENGKVAIQKYQELSPDIVTMDITMPEMDGLQSLKKILEIDPSANVIMVSAMGQESMVREAVQSGAKGFIVKPFKEDIILSALGNLR
jgi:two-component system chemotaxis response regulator CheY